MASAYQDLYAWMYSCLGSGEFTIGDFRTAFPSPAPAKVLSDLHHLGFVESIRRGVYKLVPPEDRLVRAVQREASLFGRPTHAGLPYAYCNETAITIWTDGGYWTGFTRGFRPLHLKVRRGDADAWKAFFRAIGGRVTVEGSRETLFGVVHILHPVARVVSVERGGVRVVPAREAYAFAAARPYLYEPVLPVLRRAMRGSKS